MGYLNNIEFQETKEEDGHEAMAREAEREKDVLPGSAIPPMDFARSPSPSAHSVCSAPAHSGLSSASSHSHTSGILTVSSNRLYDWTTVQKEDLAAYAEHVCRDMEIPAEEQKSFIENAQVR